MGETHSLRLMLDGFAIDDSRPELLKNRLVNGVTLCPISILLVVGPSLHTKSSTVHLFERSTTGAV
jgi:hypothetical protein